MKKTLLVMSLLSCLTLSSCADRERLNCPPTKNKALTAVTETTSTETTTAPRYASGAKCR